MNQAKVTNSWNREKRWEEIDQLPIPNIKTRTPKMRHRQIFLPTRYENCPRASINGMDSISPTSINVQCEMQQRKHWKQLLWTLNKNIYDVIVPIVPPNSMTQTSAGPGWPSTGIIAARSIHSWIASVMWGTTYRLQ